MDKKENYCRSQLVILGPDGNWHSCKYNIGDLVTYNNKVYRVQGFSVLQTTSPVHYDIGIGHNVSEDELL